MDAWRESHVSSGNLWLARRPPTLPQWQSVPTFRFQLKVQLFFVLLLVIIVLLQRWGLLCE